MMTPTGHPLASRRAALQWMASAAAVAATGCATTAPDTAVAEGWHDVPLPGKRRTSYRWQLTSEGRVLEARAESSASMFRKRVHRPPAALPEVEFAWWVDALPEGADVSDLEATDAAARVIFAFGGDHSKLSARNQAMFELARTLTGEMPPYATLAYVWDAGAPVGRVVVHPRSDRMRKIVVESGRGGLRQWKRYRRSLAADYRTAFGEAPGPLVAVAFMTDSDNTRSQITTRYRDVILG